VKHTELIHNADGSVYHIGLKPHEVADTVILVGDPTRVELFKPHFSHIEAQHAKREFHSFTGTCRGKRFTVLSTGIGPDNVEIVLAELDALATLPGTHRQLHLVRLGTCGTLQPHINPGDYVLSTHAFGSDPLPYYYPHPSGQSYPFQAAEAFAHLLASQTAAGVRLPSFYAAEASGALARQPTPRRNLHYGATFTCPGFYSPQGRSFGRIRSIYSESWHLPIANWEAPHQAPICNLEMETSALFHLCTVLGHRADSLSIVLANRYTGQFHPEPDAAVLGLISEGLKLLVEL
jgi:uridine phosphorylase